MQFETPVSECSAGRISGMVRLFVLLVPRRREAKEHLEVPNRTGNEEVSGEF